jgi:hypothetical protein
MIRCVIRKVSLLRNFSVFIVFLWSFVAAVIYPLHPTGPTPSSSIGKVASAAESEASAAAHSRPADNSGKRVQLVLDQEHGTLRIVIDGKDVGHFDATGLHVRDGIEYGGTITDIGSTYYDQHAGGKGAP